MTLINITSDNCVYFYCPACKMNHGGPLTMWTFNGNYEKPSITPSFRVRYGQDKQCHTIITDGYINYCTDCTHELAGQKIPMEECR